MTKSEMQEVIYRLEKQHIDQAVTILNYKNKVDHLEQKLSIVKSLSVDICVALQED